MIFTWGHITTDAVRQRRSRSRGNVLTTSLEKQNNFIHCQSQSLVHLLPVKAIQRAYLVASRRQCDATSSPQVTVREMMPMMMKKSVVTHSGGSRGGIHVLSRPWMVWHCRTRPTVRAPAWRGSVLIKVSFQMIYIQGAHRQTEYKEIYEVY